MACYALRTRKVVSVQAAETCFSLRALCTVLWAHFTHSFLYIETMHTRNIAAIIIHLGIHWTCVGSRHTLYNPMVRSSRVHHPFAPHKQLFREERGGTASIIKLERVITTKSVLTISNILTTKINCVGCIHNLTDFVVRKSCFINTTRAITRSIYRKAVFCVNLINLALWNTRSFLVVTIP